MPGESDEPDHRIWYQCKKCGLIAETYDKAWSHVNSHYPIINRPWKSYKAHSENILRLEVTLGHGDCDA